MIPIAKPQIGDKEKELVLEVLNSGQLSSGTLVQRFEQAFSRELGLKYCVAVSSGTSALLLSYQALGLKPGDQVFTTPFTFIATASTLKFLGLVPIFVDIDPDTFNISPYELAQQIIRYPDAKAIVVVHLYGLPCDMQPILQLCQEHNLLLIEDCAQALGATYDGKAAGTFGQVATYSFYPTKHITTGEGGLIATNDAIIADSARKLLNHGQTVKYRHEVLGLNFRLTDLQAAIGLGQIERISEFKTLRRRNAKAYDQRIVNSLLQKPVEPSPCEHVYHQYTLKVPRERESFLRYLSAQNIGYGIHYPIPLMDQPVFSGYNLSECPVARLLSSQVVSIPVHPGLSEAEINYVVDKINGFDV